jgi:hypothetical protein
MTLRRAVRLGTARGTRTTTFFSIIRTSGRALPARAFPYGPKREEADKMPQSHYAAWLASERPHQDTVESIMDVLDMHWPAAK